MRIALWILFRRASECLHRNAHKFEVASREKCREKLQGITRIVGQEGSGMQQAAAMRDQNVRQLLPGLGRMAKNRAVGSRGRKNVQG